MNDVQIFTSEDFGSIRTMIIKNEPWFAGKDIAEALGYSNASKAVINHIDGEDKMTEVVAYSPNGNTVGKLVFINESGLYSLILSSKLPSAKKFKRWITAEVLPAIRKTGSYSMAMTDEEKIQLIAKGNIKLNERIDKVEAQILTLENDVPLYGCEIEEVQKHINRRVVSLLGEKTSNAYKDKNIRASVFSDIYRQLKREYGCISTYKSIRRKYIADVHDFIDCYEPPTVLEEKIMCANAQLNF